MSKFKVGDKVRCTSCLPTQYIKLGEVYTVQKITDYCIELKEIKSPHDYLDTRFELVLEHNPVLTPEEVFEHLRKGTQLQYKQEAFPKGWRDCSNPQFANILNQEWRIKPEPAVIELNGKRYKLIEE